MSEPGEAAIGDVYRKVLDGDGLACSGGSGSATQLMSWVPGCRPQTSSEEECRFRSMQRRISRAGSRERNAVEMQPMASSSPAESASTLVGVGPECSQRVSSASAAWLVVKVAEPLSSS